MKKLLACGLILTMLSSTGAMCFANEEVEIVNAIQVVSTEVETIGEAQNEKEAQKEELLKGLEEIKNDGALTWKEKALRVWDFVKSFVKEHYVAIGAFTASAAMLVLAGIFGSELVDYIVSLFKSNKEEEQPDEEEKKEDVIVEEDKAVKQQMVIIKNHVERVSVLDNLDGDLRKLKTMIEEKNLKDIENFEEIWHFASDILDVFDAEYESRERKYHYLKDIADVYYDTIQTPLNKVWNQDQDAPDFIDVKYLDDVIEAVSDLLEETNVELKKKVGLNCNDISCVAYSCFCVPEIMLEYEIKYIQSLENLSSVDSCLPFPVGCYIEFIGSQSLIDDFKTLEASIKNIKEDTREEVIADIEVFIEKIQQERLELTEEQIKDIAKKAIETELKGYEQCVVYMQRDCFQEAMKRMNVFLLFGLPIEHPFRKFIKTIYDCLRDLKEDKGNVQVEEILSLVHFAIEQLQAFSKQLGE